MLEAGEDVRFLARRLVILASEDVGNADPHALPLAVAAMQACEFVGLPECQLPLAQAVTYLACAPNRTPRPWPLAKPGAMCAKAGCCQSLSTCATSITREHKRLGHGEGYVYSHDAEDGIAAQDYLGVQREYYRPVPRGFEAQLIERLHEIRATLRQAQGNGPA